MEDVNVELGNIQDSVQILLDCTQNPTNTSSSAPVHTIPSRVRDLNPSAFTPRVVSIGPLHRDNENLVSFEGQKAIFLRELLRQTGLPPEETLQKCLQKVHASITEIREFYDGINTCDTDDKIERMMVMDGCFILEYIYMCAYDERDRNMVLPAAIVYDLLLIENQIPFFVLEYIFDCTSSRFTTSRFTTPVVASLSLIELVSSFAQAVHIFDSTAIIKNIKKHHHILGMVHECYQASHPPPPGIPSLPIHSTADLDKAGVKFEPHHRDPEWPMAMNLESSSEFVCFSSFRWCWCWPWAKRTLRMPKLYVTGDTELILRNLIAYEQFTPHVSHHITSYAMAMDMLINTEEDVSILVESEVVFNSMGSNKEAATMINHVCDGAYAASFFYLREWEDLDTYYNSYWPRNIAWLRRTYFSNPWNMIALLAGTLLFLLTLVQTYFTINPL
ncbi:hypothetical protein OSB04_000890 [Centaurea solstitialis]|uniref:Uncharacterized protein n=1 Tax=Centaurea solstitialis TaxID=347529 RepID=A0AA38TRT5_9ASTR|nr:hypothetical protein OSB04_000890 [Centaurea solstitialis]